MNRWDKYFYNIAKSVAQNSRCLSKQIGVVIVKDHFILSTGYNGPPSGFPNPKTKEFNRICSSIAPYNRHLIVKEDSDECPRHMWNFDSGEGVNFCPCAHAEQNAISRAAQLGHPLLNSTIYIVASIAPCLNCSYLIVNSGIKEVVATELKPYEQEGFNSTIIFEQCGIKYRLYDLE